MNSWLSRAEARGRVIIVPRIPARADPRLARFSLQNTILANQWFDGRRPDINWACLISREVSRTEPVI
jgi:hypothetical protein